MRNENGLTTRQQKFVDEYFVDHNATKAAIRAGYTKNAARQAGAEILSVPVVKATILARSKKLSDDALVTTEYIINGIKRVHERCIAGKLDSAGANKALENLGRFRKLFVDRVQVEDVDDIAARIAKARSAK